MLITIIVFIVMLSILVFVHELGHFYTARKFGIRVDEFGLGIPPRAVGIRREKIAAVNEEPEKKNWHWVWGNQKLAENKPTVYSLNWLPIGGFVKIKGENGEAAAEADSFASQSIPKRILVLASGVLMNFLLCMILLMIGYGIGMPTSGPLASGAIAVTPTKIQVVELIDKLPAKEAGVKLGDVINKVDGQEFSDIKGLQNYLAGKKDAEVSVDLARGESLISKKIKVQQYQGVIGVGIALSETQIVRYPWHLAVWYGFKMTFIWLAFIFVALFTVLKNLIFGVPVGLEVTGPVGIAVMTGEATRMGVSYLLQFVALISLNLAIINILPFPALDGGRILFLLIEKIRGRAIKQKWENLSHNIGFVLLMLLVLVVTYKDVIRYGGRIAGVFKQLIGM